MRFVDSHVDQERRFSIGREDASGRYYLAIPVANRLVDYEEYYEISQAVHDAYPTNIDALNRFADRCRARECDELLFLQPGGDRGAAV
jgi:hypothetical protein